MIITVTLNPSVDISYKLNDFETDTVNRVTDVSKTAGGKGINVTRVLRQLKEEIAATGFLGGTLGDFIRSEISAIGVENHFVQIEGDTRNCIAIIHDGNQTEILESGPKIKETEAERFLEKFTSSLPNASLVTISGSLPDGLTADFYKKLLDMSAQHHTKVLFDTNGSILKQVLKSSNKPFLIKPNDKELADLLDRQIENENQLVDVLQNEIFHDIPWIVVTLGAKGAIVKNNDAIYRATIPHVNAINPVGSGDSVIAGFAAGLARKLSGKRLISFGLVMGVLNAMEEKTGQIDPTKVDKFVKKIQVERIK